MARDEDLLGKAFDLLNQVAEASKLEYFRMHYEGAMEDYAMWNVQLKSKKPPKKEECIELISFSHCVESDFNLSIKSSLQKNIKI